MSAASANCSSCAALRLSVPDLGLDSNGQMSLDFGPRRFVVTINANLEAILTDGDGNAQKTLPKPVKADNAHKAKTATAQWTEFKAALKGQATDQKKRFEHLDRAKSRRRHHFQVHRPGARPGYTLSGRSRPAPRTSSARKAGHCAGHPG